MKAGDFFCYKFVGLKQIKITENAQSEIYTGKSGIGSGQT